MRNKLLLSSVYSYKTYVPEKKKKLIQENAIPACRAGPLARAQMENVHLT